MHCFHYKNKRISNCPDIKSFKALNCLWVPHSGKSCTMDMNASTDLIESVNKILRKENGSNQDDYSDIEGMCMFGSFGRVTDGRRNESDNTMEVKKTTFYFSDDELRGCE